MTKMFSNKESQEENDTDLYYENNEYKDEEINKKEKKQLTIETIKKNPIFLIVAVLILVIIILLIIKGCKNNNEYSDTVSGESQIVTLNKTSLSMLIGDDYTLVAKVPKNSSSVAWSSEDNDIVSIDNNGNIYAIQSGTVEVSAVYIYNDRAYSTSCSVTVNKEKVVAEEISFVDSNISITKGTDYKIEPVFFPTNVNDKELIWRSSDESIATVDNGVIKPLKAGTVKITATTNNNKTASTIITIPNNASSVTEIIASPKVITLKVGEISKISYLVLPDSALNKTVTFTSNSSRIATVSSSGNVLAISPGTTTIIVATNDENKKDVINVIVSANDNPTSQPSQNGTTSSDNNQVGTNSGGTVTGGMTSSGSVTCSSGWVWLETPEPSLVGFATEADKSKLQAYSGNINIKVTRVSNCISELYYKINDGTYIKTGYGKQISLTNDGDYTITIKGVTTSGGTVYATYYAKKSASATSTPTNPCGSNWVWLTTPEPNYVGFVKETDKSKLVPYDGTITISISNVSSCISKLYYSIDGGSYISTGSGKKITITANGGHTIKIKGITTTGGEIYATYYANKGTSNSTSSTTPTNPCGSNWVWLTTPEPNYVGFVKETDKSKLVPHNGIVTISISNVSSCISKLYYNTNNGSYISTGSGKKITLNDTGSYTIKIKGITTAGGEIYATYYAKVGSLN